MLDALAGYIQALLATVNLANGFDWRVALVLAGGTFLEEAGICVPFLLAGISALLAYNLSLNPTPVAVLTLTSYVILAGVGKLFGVSLFYGIIRQAMHSLGFAARLQNTAAGRVYRRHRDRIDSGLRLWPATVAMFTPLNTVTKVALSMRGRFWVILAGTAISGAACDALTLCAGYFYHATTWPVGYLPAYFAGFVLVVMMARQEVMRYETSKGKEANATAGA